MSSRFCFITVLFHLSIFFPDFRLDPVIAGFIPASVGDQSPIIQAIGKACKFHGILRRTRLLNFAIWAWLFRLLPNANSPRNKSGDYEATHRWSRLVMLTFCGKLLYTYGKHVNISWDNVIFYVYKLCKT